jgi:hypothetical protein
MLPRHSEYDREGFCTSCNTWHPLTTILGMQALLCPHVDPALHPHGIGFSGPIVERYTRQENP